ncbi:MAG: hypothetical protein M5R36_08560 [Deltaproteobacteria bacterium]|nr:hypothetical protein [Deltaproteobacteria bacterium]
MVGGDGSPGTMDFRRAAAMLNDTATGQVLRGEVVPIYLKNGGVRLLAEFETFMTPGPRQAKVWIDGRALTSNSIDVDSLTRGSARWRN